MTINDFIEELDIAIKQDGHDIYLKADSAKMIRNLIISINSEHKNGEWIKTNNPNYSSFDGTDGYIYACNQCNKKTLRKSNFCPNCGAEMKQ